MGRRPRRRQPPWASLVLLLPVVPEIDDAEALAIKPRKDQRVCARGVPARHEPPSLRRSYVCSHPSAARPFPPPTTPTRRPHPSANSSSISTPTESTTSSSCSIPATGKEIVNKDYVCTDGRSAQT
ncbi:Os09g0432099 [Oryza sativa Japonica Group]|uniref:Os09g0432099 protein n=1 Tax=Oryza sativa subsp. japonica TaxID=39947 RepID=A0A0P0XN96_ORYSJ|nr:Os09g0432099 [Oryza sativa Japonica Group]